MTTVETDRAQLVFQAKGVVKRFGRRRRSKAAVDGVDLTVYLGESLGIVGESGSGKTTLGRILMGFDTATEGEALFHGESIAAMRGRSRARFRRRVQMVFQNPYASLNPLRTIGSSLADGYRGSGKTARQRTQELLELLDKVGLNESILERYPHEFSGGQRQRIVLARALTVGPDVLVADEPLSALDVSIQAQVLNLLNDLRQSLGLTVVMITHDLRVVNFFCDRIAVMYMGSLVEIGSRDEIMNRAWHPYTRMLISAAPHDTPGAIPDRPWIRNDPDERVDAETGCRFAARCWLREALGNPEKCVTERPALREVPASTLPADGVHGTACHFAEEVATAATAVER